MVTTRKRGNLDQRERPDSPEWDYGTQQITCTRTFEGMYADLLGSVPKLGTEQDGYEGLLIENVKLKKAVSGRATMTVLLQVNVDSGTNTYPQPFQPIYEIEWCQLERPLEQNDCFFFLFNPPLSGSEILKNRGLLDDFDAAVNASGRQTAYAALSTETTGKLQQLAQAKMAGETTYLLFAPVARITSEARNVTAANKCGQIFATVPGFPADILPPGYKWLSTADRSTRTGYNGKWQRIQEWTGATSINTFVYPNSSGSHGSGA